MLMLAVTAVLSTTPMPPRVAGWAEGKFGIGHGGYRIGELKRRLEALDAVTRAPLPEAMFTIARF